MKRKRSVVVENDQWVHVYTMPDGIKHVVYCAPYKLPTAYQKKLALKRAGIVLPVPPPSCEITDLQRAQTAAERVGILLSGKALDPRGMPERYMHLGKWITLYYCAEYRIKGPDLTARQEFEQKVFNNVDGYNDADDADDADEVGAP